MSIHDFQNTFTFLLFEAQNRNNYFLISSVWKIQCFRKSFWGLVGLGFNRGCRVFPQKLGHFVANRFIFSNFHFLLYFSKFRNFLSDKSLASLSIWFCRFSIWSNTDWAFSIVELSIISENKFSLKANSFSFTDSITLEVFSFISWFYFEIVWFSFRSS